MCGIVGFIGFAPEVLETALERLRHRGPDHQGSHHIAGTECALGHARLSIIDVDPRSNQPFLGAGGGHVLVYNGEIYNYRELKAELSALGQHFWTTSDTEVLLAWLIHFGTAGLIRIEGMFAFCWADLQMRRLVLARDPIGEKPLYFTSFASKGRHRFGFASEIKGLTHAPGLDRTLDRAALTDYLRFLYTAPPNTLLRGIRELPPGHWMEVDIDSAESSVPQRYYDLEENVHQSYTSSVAAAQLFRHEFVGSVERRLMSDVPVGLYLSAGMDSNAILCAARETTPDLQLQSFTVKYFEDFDESSLARQSAAWFGVGNTAVPFRDVSIEYALEKVRRMFDQPFGNFTAIAAERIAETAARSCRVCLSGDGGDELLVGYPRYKALRYHGLFARLPGIARSTLLAASGRLSQTGQLATVIRWGREFLEEIDRPMEEAFLNWSTYLDSQTLAEVVDGEPGTGFYCGLLDLFRRHAADPLRAAALVDLKSFVPFNLLQCADRASMSHSLELRVPFLAPRLVEGLPGASIDREDHASESAEASARSRASRQAPRVHSAAAETAVYSTCSAFHEEKHGLRRGLPPRPWCSHPANLVAKLRREPSRGVAQRPEGQLYFPLGAHDTRALAQSHQLASP